MPHVKKNPLAPYGNVVQKMDCENQKQNLSKKLKKKQ